MTEFLFNESLENKKDFFSFFLNKNSLDNITVKSFEYNDKKIVFKIPYQINLSKNNYGYYADDDCLDIHCYGKTIDELREDLKSELQEIYHGYVDFDTNKLSDGGKKLKSKFENMIECVKQI